MGGCILCPCRGVATALVALLFIRRPEGQTPEESGERRGGPALRVAPAPVGQRLLAEACSVFF